MTHKRTATAMMANDLKNNGFRVQYNLNSDLVVSLNNRPISVSEVSMSLYRAGYDIMQFDARPQHGQVIVKAIVG